MIPVPVTVPLGLSLMVGALFWTLFSMVALSGSDKKATVGLTVGIVLSLSGFLILIWGLL